MSIIRKTYGVHLGASTMYPTLNNLESKNLVTNEWKMGNSHPKKVYKLTQEGKNELQYSIFSLSQICKTLYNDSKKTDKNIQMGVLIE
jgi:DNA-binding PadR family transcriptional regulator